MENIEYKICLLEIISMIKDKSTYLKSLDANSPTYNQHYFDGMAIAYHFILDGIVTYLNDNDINLSDFGLENYDPVEILKYRPLNYKE